MQNKLGISIPTYNRADILESNLLSILDELIQYQIPVYISDDSNNNDTKIAIEKLQLKHSLIYYFKNEPSLGHDKNCIKSITLSREEYVWYLGDGMIIKKGSIPTILSIVNKESPDFIVFKEENRQIDMPSQLIRKADIVFNDFAWHLTMSGVTVYRKKNINFEKFDVSRFKNFPQLALIFFNFKDNVSNFFWLNERLIVGNENKKSYWSRNVFEVFFKDLKNTLLNLPQHFEVNMVDAVIKEHSVKSEIFGYGSLARFRIVNVFNYKIFNAFFLEFRKLTGCNIIILFFLSFFPRRLLNLIYRLKHLSRPYNLINKFDKS